MDEKEWLRTKDSLAMFDYLVPAVSIYNDDPCQISERKLRLFAIACTRRNWPTLTDKRSHRAVEVAERLADGEDEKGEVAAAQDAVDDTDWEVSNKAAHDARYMLGSARLAAREVVSAPTFIPRAVQAHILRDIVGNPFRPGPAPLLRSSIGLDGLCRCKCSTQCPLGKTGSTARCSMKELQEAAISVPGPLTAQVMQLAMGAYQGRDETGCLDNGMLAALADALEEAGLPQTEPVEKPVRVLVWKSHESWNAGLLGEGPVAAELMGPRDLTFMAAEKHWNVKNWERYNENWAGDGFVIEQDPNALLAHLRSEGPHSRGCWAIDHILGRR